MVLGIFIGSLILAIVFGVLWLVYEYETLGDVSFVISFISVIVSAISLAIGGLFGFINQPATEGTHQGVVTAVDLEGVYFRRYEVYLKSSGYTTQSDETTYKIYDYEKDLAEELKSCIGKEVKLNYGHDGGYIGWNSCGTYHIKSVEVIE